MALKHSRLRKVPAFTLAMLGNLAVPIAVLAIVMALITP